MPRRPATAGGRPSTAAGGIADAGAQMIIDNIKKEFKARGSGGFLGLQRRFKIMDDDGSKSLSLPEFKKAMKEMKVDVPESDLRKIFELFDRDFSGTVSFEELLQGLREPMNEKRLSLVKKAFRVIDVDGSGIVDVKEIASMYDASKHPEVISGKRTPQDVLLEFLDTFDVGGEKDGMVSEAEFANYYANISASIDNDQYFELMIRNAWHLSGGTGQAANSSNRRVLATASDGTQSVREITNDLGIRADDKKEMMRRLQTQGVDVGGGIDLYGAGEDNARTRFSSQSGGFGTTQRGVAGTSTKRPSSASIMGRRAPARSLNNTMNSTAETIGIYGSANATRFSAALQPPAPAKYPMQQKLVVETLLEVMRAQLMTRGTDAVISLQRVFMDMDSDGSGSLDYEEFKAAMAANGFPFSQKHNNVLFAYFDRDGSGAIEYQEFLDGLRGSFPPELDAMLGAIFDGMDHAMTGIIDPQEILANYNAKQHPDVVSRRRMPDEVFQEFVDTFDVGAAVEGKVTRDEFIRYYKNIAVAMNGDYRGLQEILSSVWGIEQGPLKRPMSRTMAQGPVRGKRGKESVMASRLREAKTMSSAQYTGY